MEKCLAILPGDGIGPEVMAEALKSLEAVSKRFRHTFRFKPALVGGAAFDQYGRHLPEETLAICKQTDAILFGSVGGPINESHLDKWKNCELNALLGIRKAFHFGVNLRPARVYPQLKEICPLRTEVISAGVDMLIVRELLGGIYFGRKENLIESGKRVALDECRYDEQTITTVARFAFGAAQQRRKKLTSVDKANILHCSKLWRTVVAEVSRDYPDVKLENMLVDNCAMQIIKNPAQFDVVLTENMFGDILSDAAAVLPGSLGLTPSASLNSQGFGLYEPSGGSAPDISGKGIANPIAEILSVAMLLRYSFGLSTEAAAIENAVDLALDQGIRTADIQKPGLRAASTAEVGDAIAKFIGEV